MNRQRACEPGRPVDSLTKMDSATSPESKKFSTRDFLCFEKSSTCYRGGFMNRQRACEPGRPADLLTKTISASLPKSKKFSTKDFLCFEISSTCPHKIGFSNFITIQKGFDNSRLWVFEFPHRPTVTRRPNKPLDHTHKSGFLKFVFKTETMRPIDKSSCPKCQSVSLERPMGSPALARLRMILLGVSGIREWNSAGDSDMPQI